MKKLKKLLSVVSAVAMTATAFAIPVSADTYNYWYDTTKVNNKTGVTYPLRIEKNVSFCGIIVTMFDETVPTAETLGIDENIDIADFSAQIPPYYTYVEKLIKNEDGSLGFKEGGVISDEKYYEVHVESDNYMSEEEAAEFVKELMLSGKVKNAEVLYRCDITEWYVNRNYEDESDNIQKYSISVNYKDGFDTSDFSFEKYPEIAENFEVEDLSYKQVNNGIKVLVNDESEFYPSNMTMKVYNAVAEMNKTLPEKYEEIESIELSYAHKLVAIWNYAVTESNISWGDATGDEIIDLYDAIEVSKHLMGTGTMNDSAVILADINRDGKTDLYDVIDISKSMLLNYVSMNGDIDNSQQVLADFNNDGIINVADILAVNTEHLSDVMGN